MQKRADGGRGVIRLRIASRQVNYRQNKLTTVNDDAHATELKIWLENS